MKRFFFLFLLLFAAAPAQALEISAAERQRLVEINRYINSTQTMVADFTQVAPDGSIGYGRFFLKRPGKFRWQYDPPIPLLIIGNGQTMAYHDLELDQISHVPTRDNLASMLAKPELDVAKDLKLEKLEERAGTMRLTVRDKTVPDQGSLTLVFTVSPVQLGQLEVVDATGQMTRLSLTNLTYGSALDDTLFRVDEAGRLLRRSSPRQ